MCAACGTSNDTKEPSDPVETQQPEETQAGNATEPQQQQNEPTVSSKEENADTLVVAVSTEPTSLDPQNNSLLAGMTVERQIYDTLVSVDNETGEIKPSLATEYYRRLYRDVSFHSGRIGSALLVGLDADDRFFTQT